MADLPKYHLRARQADALLAPINATVHELERRVQHYLDRAQGLCVLHFAVQPNPQTPLPDTGRGRQCSPLPRRGGVGGGVYRENA